MYTRDLHDLQAWWDEKVLQFAVYVMCLWTDVMIAGLNYKHCIYSLLNITIINNLILSDSQVR